MTSVHLARHTPTGTLVTIKITNLEIEISHESTEGSALLALSAYCKTREERKKLRKELLSKKKTV